jgi:tetratricopeptide (TPR) repeat protein
LTDTLNLHGNGAWIVMNLFGAMSLPEVVVVDPESRIVWRGSPNDRLEERLLAICEQTQPLAGDPKRMAQRMRQSDKLLDQGEIGQAYTLARSIWLVTEDGSSERGDARNKMDKLEAAAGEWLKKAIEAERAGEKDKAARIVAQIAGRFDDPELRDEQREGDKDKDKLQVVKDAEAEIGRMNGDRTLKQAIKAAQDQCQAEVLLEKGADFEEVNRFDDALVCYRQVIKKYKDAAGAKTAQANIDKIKNDKKLRVAVDKSRDEAEAARWLDIADRCAKLELFDEAREYYERLVKEHPKSEEAKQAKEKLSKLPAPAKETAGADPVEPAKTAKANTP